MFAICWGQLVEFKVNPLSWMKSPICADLMCFKWVQKHIISLALHLLSSAWLNMLKKVQGVEAVLGFRCERRERWRKRLFIWKIAHISKNNDTESLHIASGVSVMFFFDRFPLMGDLMLPSSRPWGGSWDLLVGNKTDILGYLILHKETEDDFSASSTK